MEPRRLLQSSQYGERQLILAALAETPPVDAWKRATSRLAEAGVVLGAAGILAGSATLASHATANTLVVSESGLVSGVAGTALAKAVFIKALLIGFSLGGAALLGGHLVQRAADPSPITRQCPATPRANPSHETIATAARSDVTAPDEPVAAMAATETAPSRTSSSSTRAVTPDIKAQPGLVATEATVSNEVVPTAELPPEVPPNSTLDGSQLLKREVAAIARARQALQRRDGKGALRELDAVSGFQILSQEAALLRVEAMAMSGQKSAAATLARQLLISGAATAHRQRLLELAAEKK